MPSECVKVMVRIRPLNSNEQNRNSKIIVNVDDKTKSILLSRAESSEEQRQFSYDAVFQMNELQEKIYETAAFGLVESVIEGFNGTMFAYGQTGSGKTFTMMGDPQSDKYKGIIPRTFEHIVNAIESAEKNKQFLVRVAFIEIYQEEIHDLLGKDVKARCEMKEHPDEGVYVKGLVWETVKTIVEMERAMIVGNKNRSTGETLMNKDSSRSHSLFTIKIEMSETDEKGNERFTLGKLRLVDLAGSERQSKTQATGDRLKEAQKINLSLSALGNVISALVDGKSTHIPYRDSKLTRLLQDSLGGNTKTVMIACCSPANYNYDETLGTLRYASRAKHIQNQPKINEDPKDALLKEYADEIKRLKAMLEGKDIQGPGGEMIKDANGKVVYVYKDGPNGKQIKDPAMLEKLKQRDQMIENERMQKEKLMELIKVKDQTFYIV